jgi:transcriptional regulator with XRE-family HTH domain
VAFRLAHGWSQRQAADEWNSRWPDEPKNLKSFSYWEVWPSSTGHEPSLEVLNRLAHLYQCSVADLMIDLADYSRLDAITSSTTTALPLRTLDAEPVPNNSSVRVAVTEIDLPDNFIMLLTKHLDSRTLSEVEGLAATSQVTQQRLDRLLTVPMRPQPGPASSRHHFPSQVFASGVSRRGPRQLRDTDVATTRQCLRPARRRSSPAIVRATPSHGKPDHMAIKFGLHQD